VADGRPFITPIRSGYRLSFLSERELQTLQAATLTLLEEVGVKVQSERCLSLLAEAGARVDRTSALAKLPADLVMKAMAHVRRSFHLGARLPELDLHLEEGLTFFTTDGCGVEVVDPATGARRPSTKDDVARIARIADALPAISFMWPTVAAGDCGETARLHELDAGWNNTVKHMGGMVGGQREARYAVEMALVVAGGAAELRRRPPLSDLICTVAPLCLDRDGMEAALVFAEAGVPVGFMAMPTIGTTAPATQAGALIVGDAEVIAATVIVQLASPGAAVFHSLLQAWADPRSGAYIGYPLDSRGRYASVEIGHHWGMPTLGGSFGTESERPGTWQAAAEVALDPFMVALTGSELVTGIGLSDTYTCLYPEGIFLDADIYDRARHALMGLEIDDEQLAIDVVKAVGPAGHFLGQAHTRRHMRDAVKFPITYQLGPDGTYKDPMQVARERYDDIVAHHQPQPLEEDKRLELTRILAAADAELRQEAGTTR